jgi:hypothetical protein
MTINLWIIERHLVMHLVEEPNLASGGEFSFSLCFVPGAFKS